MGSGFSSCSCEVEAKGQIGEKVKGEVDIKVEVNGKDEKKEEKKESKK